MEQGVAADASAVWGRANRLQTNAIVGSGAYEVRVQIDGGWRVMYVAKFELAIYALHAFHKKTQKTRKDDIELAKKRYKQIGVSQ